MTSSRITGPWNGTDYDGRGEGVGRKWEADGGEGGWTDLECGGGLGSERGLVGKERKEKVGVGRAVVGGVDKRVMVEKTSGARVGEKGGDGEGGDFIAVAR